MAKRGEDSAHGSRRQCAFCEQPADSQEHVVPKWLQKHFALFDQHLGLCNGTTIRYKQAVVPACLKCNHDRLGPLEKRVREGSATKRDLFLWALKITYGLSVRDSTLPATREDPTGGSLVAPDKFVETEGLLKHALRCLDSPTFRFVPDPFGSVVFIDSAASDFVLIDVPAPFRALAHLAIPREIQLKPNGIFAAPVPRRLQTIDQDLFV